MERIKKRIFLEDIAKFQNRQLGYNLNNFLILSSNLRTSTPHNFMAVISYILGLILIIGLSLVSIGFFILNINPDTIKRLELIIFYLSFFLAASGIFALAGTILRKMRTEYLLSWKIIRPALRQGIILALILTIIFILLPKDLFDWRIGLLLTASGLLFEGLIHIREKQNYAKGIGEN